MKKFLLSLTLLSFTGILNPLSAMEPIVLQKPDMDRGKNIMQSLASRQSTRKFADKRLTAADLSDLLWAATGVNRPESGKRTNPTAMNRQEIEVYACMEEGSYLYDHLKHELTPVGEGDARPVKLSPVCLVIVGPEDFRLAEVDAGIVSQNISLFCAGVGLATVPRAQMDREALKKALGLAQGKIPILNHPVGYFAE